ncbi:hypothetical protein BDN70DRAFT_901895 [Pholiota conissans]|uniref:Uncharacterized protein n=1 Tax=Pholiota conissans TaxID=109636 RepID=A0A9P5YKR0_9AGAR|nr:hypothetical protein BDN70DRAFT_901895 [Pholiota conissans]
MANKGARKIIPVYCDQPSPKVALEDEPWYFGPIRIVEDRLPMPKGAKSGRGRYSQIIQSRPLTTYNAENTSPPSTQLRRRSNTPENPSAPGSSEVLAISPSRKSSKRTRATSPSSLADDRGAKRRWSSASKAGAVEDGLGRIADSIDRLAAEAREDRKEITDAMKGLLQELRKRV